MPVEAFARYLQNTPVSLFLQSQAAWLWPLSETVHFIGLALLIGATGFFDLRLLGFMKRVPLTVRAAIHAAGAARLRSQSDDRNSVLRGPALSVRRELGLVGEGRLLLVAGVNAMFFETTQGARVLAIGAGDDTPLIFKVVGALSLLAWFAVLYFGRMLPFFA
jgi:hypothetical protein